MKEGWEYKKLGEICQILDSQRKPVTKKDRRKGVYPYYGASGIQDYVDSYIFDGRYLLVGEDGAKWGASDKSAFIIEGKCWVNNHAHILEVSENVNDKLIEYYLTFKDLSEYITGAIVPKLTQKALTSIPIPIPPFSEQQQIVEELDLLSSIIEKKKEQLKELDNLAQSIFYDMFGDPVANEKGWEVMKLEELCRLFAGGDVPKERFSKTKTANYQIPVYSNGIEDSGLYGYTDIPKVTEKCITISGRGTIGHVEKRLEAFYPIIRLLVVVPIVNIDVTYLAFFAKLKDFKGNGGAIPQLTVPMIKKEKCPLPPLSLQQQFASKIEIIERQKELIKQSIKEVETLFNSRMDYYFN